jgi:5,6-dimethylbenzimidazole synthase
VALNEFPPEWRHGVYQAIALRRDIRRFRPDPIDPKTLARILAAAHQAASVGFSQPWNFILIDDLETRRRIREHVERERIEAADGFVGARRVQYLSLKLEGILDAALNICVTCDRTRFGPSVIGRNTMKDADIYSTCIAIQNLWLAARTEGIGVGWVSILKPEVIQQILAIPAHVALVGYLCVGYPVEFTERPLLQSIGWLPRLPLSELVFRNRWNTQPDDKLKSELSQFDKGFCDDDTKHVTGGE